MIRLIHFRKATESVVIHKRTFLLETAIGWLVDCRGIYLKLRKWSIYLICHDLYDAYDSIISQDSSFSANVSICKLAPF